MAAPSDLQSLAQRLSDAIERAGGKAKVSRRSGIPVSSIDRYTTAKSEPPALRLGLLAAACDATSDYLLTGKAPTTPEPGQESRATELPSHLKVTKGSDLGEGFVRVPRFDVKASAGVGRQALATELEPHSEIAFRTAWLRSLGVMPEHAQFLVAEGDSMLDTIHDGDLLLVNRLIDRVVNDAIYVVVLAGAVMVKRLQLLFDGSIMLISDNPRYRPERVDRAEVERLQVEGRVRWYGRAI